MLPSGDVETGGFVTRFGARANPDCIFVITPRRPGDDANITAGNAARRRAGSRPKLRPQLNDLSAPAFPAIAEALRMQINDRETGFLDVYHPCWSIGETSRHEPWCLTRILVDMIDATVIQVVVNPGSSLTVCGRVMSLARWFADPVASTAHYQNDVSEPANTREEVR